MTRGHLETFAIKQASVDNYARISDGRLKPRHPPFFLYDGLCERLLNPFVHDTNTIASLPWAIPGNPGANHSILFLFSHPVNSHIPIPGLFLIKEEYGEIKGKGGDWEGRDLRDSPYWMGVGIRI